MNKINFIQMLANDIEEEQEYIKEYQEAERKCETDREEQGKNFNYWDSQYSSMKNPSKQKIKDDVKMIRRLALEISKEEI